MAWYRTGAVNLTNGSPNVVGVGTGWVARVRQSDAFVGPDGRPREVLSVNSDTSITLASPYTGPTASGAAYEIYQTQGRIQSLLDAVGDLLTESDPYSVPAAPTPISSASRMLLSQSGVNRHITVGNLAAAIASLSPIPGAAGDGVADDTAALQACLSSTNQLLSPPGRVYRITAPLTLAQSATVNMSMSTILLDDPTGAMSHMIVGDGISQCNGVKIENTTFVRQQAGSAGTYAINCNFVGVLRVRNNRIFGDSKIHSGVRLHRAIIVDFANNHVDNYQFRGLVVTGSDAGANRSIDVTITKNRIEGGSNAIWVGDFVEGLFMRQNILFNTSGDGMIVDATSNTNGLFSFKIQHNDFDTCGIRGLYVDKVSNLQICGNWFSSNLSGDIEIAQLTDGVLCTGNQIYPAGAGIVARGNSAKISGNLISGGTTCASIAPTATNTSVVGNTFSNAIIGVDLSTAQGSLVVANDIFNMSSAPIANEGGPGTRVYNNRGDNGAGSLAYVAVGASPFTYTAGPRPEYVRVFGGAVSQISMGGNAISFSSDTSFMLAPGQAVTITYSSLPFMVRNLLP